MSSTETQLLTQTLKRSLTSLLIWGVLYGGLLILLLMMRPKSFPGDDALLIPSLIGAFLLTAIGLIAGGILWKKTSLEALKDVPARKFGAKEREAGLTPRAQLLRKRIILTATCFEIPAFIGFALPLMGGRSLLWVGMALIAGSVATVFWLTKQVPERVREALG
ncbi:hypothetical protein D3C87_869900 [compost metagenome]